MHPILHTDGGRKKKKNWSTSGRRGRKTTSVHDLDWWNPSSDFFISNNNNNSQEKMAMNTSTEHESLEGKQTMTYRTFYVDLNVLLKVN